MIGRLPLPPGILQRIESLAPRLRGLQEPLNSEAVKRALLRLQQSPAQQWLPGFVEHQFPNTIPLGNLGDASIPALAKDYARARFRGFTKLISGDVPNPEQGWHDFGGPIEAWATEDVPDPVDEILRNLTRIADVDDRLYKYGIKGRGPQWRIEGD